MSNDPAKLNELLDEALGHIHAFLIAQTEQERIDSGQKKRLQALAKDMNQVQSQLRDMTDRDERFAELIEVGRELAAVTADELELSRSQHAELISKLRLPFAVEQYLDPEKQEEIGLDLDEARRILLGPSGAGAEPLSLRDVEHRVEEAVASEESDRRQHQRELLAEILGDVRSRKSE